MSKSFNVSMYVKQFLVADGRTYDEAAEVLGVTTQTFRNKISNNCFSLEQIVKMAQAFGWTISVEIKPRREEKVVVVTDTEGMKLTI